MEDNNHMIAAAKRKARRLARKTDLSYQQALDHVARHHGRAHWGAFLEDPVEIVRDEMDRDEDDQDSSDDVLQAPSPFSLCGREWNLPEITRLRHFEGRKFVPGWNALTVPELSHGSDKRNAVISEIAGIMMSVYGYVPNDIEPDGRRVLEGFIMAELQLAARQGRTPSIPALIEWINQGLRNLSSLKKKDRDADHLGEWIRKVVMSSEDDGYVDERLSPLVEMEPMIRSRLFGAMDKSLIPFKDKTISLINSM